MNEFTCERLSGWVPITQLILRLYQSSHSSSSFLPPLSLSFLPFVIEKYVLSHPPPPPPQDGFIATFLFSPITILLCPNFRHPLGARKKKCVCLAMEVPDLERRAFLILFLHAACSACSQQESLVINKLRTTDFVSTVMFYLLNLK